MKKYIRLKENNQNVNNVEIEVYYNLGGSNIFTGKTEARGYYLRILPVNIEDKDGYNLITFGAFTGLKLCLKTVKRKSAKAEQEAIEKVLSNLENLVKFALQNTGLEIAKEL